MIGELLGRFRLVDEAARTEAATLYRARDESGGEATAVAVLAPDSIKTIGDSRALRRRVMTLRAMDSPHVLRPLAERASHPGMVNECDCSSGRRLRLYRVIDELRPLGFVFFTRRWFDY